MKSLKLVFQTGFRLLLISRPAAWVIHLTVFFGGAFFVGSEITMLLLIQGVSFTFPLGILVYGVNDIYDFESDIRNTRKSGGIWTSPLDTSLMKPLVIIGILSGFLVLGVSLFTFEWLNVVSVIIGLFLGLAYSIPPLRLKNRPPFDLACNALPQSMLFLAGTLFGNAPITTVVVGWVFVLLWSTALSLLSSVGDIVPDREAHEKTLPIQIGLRRSLEIIIVLKFLIVAYWMVFFRSNLALGVAVMSIGVSMVLCIIEWFKHDEKRMKNLYTRIAVIVFLGVLGWFAFRW